MSRKRFCLILTVEGAGGLMLFGCRKKSSEGKDRLPVWKTCNRSRSGLAGNIL